MSRNGFLIALVWICIGAIIYYLADNIQNPNKINALGSDTEVVLKRGLDGHYRAEAFINEQKVNELTNLAETYKATDEFVSEIQKKIKAGEQIVIYGSKIYYSLA